MKTELTSIKKGFDTFKYDETIISNEMADLLTTLMKDPSELDITRDEEGKIYIITSSMHGDFYDYTIFINGENYRIQPNDINSLEEGYSITKEERGINLIDFIEVRELLTDNEIYDLVMMP